MENLSKKQQKRLARMEKKEKQRIKDSGSRQTKSALTWLITVAIIIGIVWGLVLLVRSGSNSDVVATAEEITDEDWTLGPIDAPIQLIEYSDFQCPACAAYESVLKQIKSEYSDTLEFAYRHFPLRSIHPHAQLAGQAAEAAGLQGKFWEMHEKIFETQPIWSVRPRVDDFFVDLASEIGLDTEQFEDDLRSDIVKSAVDADYLSAINAGVSATPTFILNGNRIPNPAGIEQFRQVLDAALAAAQTESTSSTIQESSPQVEQTVQ